MAPDNEPLQVRLTPQAELDLEAIWIWTASAWSVAQADAYITALTDKIRMLAGSPLMTAERSEFSPPVRMLRHQSHLIIYRINGEFLDVLRAPHVRQDWQSLLGEG